ncbi:MAG TPA: hypothetical protein VNZ53_26590 [Steroidobacteraceae bacterium]|jgi:hypothetical protein|nr:hypothetical protein [Steroidobacteraceae bacterium]
MALKNQIGLEGDVTPPKFVAGVRATETIKGARSVIDTAWLRIYKKMHPRYPALETVIELRLPFKREVYALVFDDVFVAHKQLFIAFGRTGIVYYAGHLRWVIGIDSRELDAYHTELLSRVYVPPEPVGYKNPINLANYK